MQAAYSSQSTSAYMPSTGFYNGSSSQTPYHGVLAPTTYTAMGVPSHAGARALTQHCKNGQSLGERVIRPTSRVSC